MKWDHICYVESDSQPGRQYEISRRSKDQHLGCNCPAYRFAPGSNKTCKHLDAYSLGEAIERSVSVTDGVPARTVKATIGRETFSFRRAISFGKTLNSGDRT